MAEQGFHNRTPFSATQALLVDERGAETITLIAKATFDLRAGGATLAASQQPLCTAPIYRAAPGASSLLCDTDLGVARPWTDVLLAGHATPMEPGATETWVELHVGPIEKRLRVVGERRWMHTPSGFLPSAPLPFERIPLLWENAFGGPGFDRNPCGVGFLHDHAQDLEGARLPNVEDPSATLRTPGDTPAPAGFGCVCPTWMPRRARAGTFDATWEAQNFPRLPVDFDPIHHSAAPDDQRVPGSLRGGEVVEIRGVSTDGPLRFTVPSLVIEGRFRLRRAEPRSMSLSLDTLRIDADRRRIELCFRASAAIHRRVHELAWAELTLTPESARDLA